MKNKSQIKRVISKAAQLALLLVLFVAVGFVLPIYAAPYVADMLSVTTPYEAAREIMSVRIEDRNASNGETFSIGVSNPASSVRITSLSYSCFFSDITLAYVDGGVIKEIPCDVALELPEATQHEILALTNESEITYVPLDLILENESHVGEISVVVAVAASDAEGKSRLENSSTVTLQSFPARKPEN